MIILSKDDATKTIALSTKALEPSPGDILRDPQPDFPKAEEIAAAFRKVKASKKKRKAEAMAQEASPIHID